MPPRSVSTALYCSPFVSPAASMQLPRLGEMRDAAVTSVAGPSRRCLPARAGNPRASLPADRAARARICAHRSPCAGVDSLVAIRIELGAHDRAFDGGEQLVVLQLARDRFGAREQTPPACPCCRDPCSAGTSAATCAPRTAGPRHTACPAARRLCPAVPPARARWPPGPTSSSIRLMNSLEASARCAWNFASSRCKAISCACRAINAPNASAATNNAADERQRQPMPRRELAHAVERGRRPGQSRARSPDVAGCPPPAPTASRSGGCDPSPAP